MLNDLPTFIFLTNIRPPLSTTCFVYLFRWASIWNQTSSAFNDINGHLSGTNYFRCYLVSHNLTKHKAFFGCQKGMCTACTFTTWKPTLFFFCCVVTNSIQFSFSKKVGQIFVSFVAYRINYLSVRPKWFTLLLDTTNTQNIAGYKNVHPVVFLHGFCGIFVLFNDNSNINWTLLANYTMCKCINGVSCFMQRYFENYWIKRNGMKYMYIPLATRWSKVKIPLGTTFVNLRAHPAFI